MAATLPARFFLVSSNMPEADLGTDIGEAKRKARMARETGLFEGLRLVRRTEAAPVVRYTDAAGNWSTTPPAERGITFPKRKVSAWVLKERAEQLPCFDAADHER